MKDYGLPVPWGVVPAERIWRTIAVPQPAAGVDWSVSVPGGALWGVQGFRAQLVTGAAVAARAPRISITDGEVEVTAGRAFDADIPANSTAILGGYTGWDCGGSGATLNPGVSLPEWPLQADWTFGIVTRALQAADQWSGIRLVVAQYEVRGLERAVERYERQVAEAIAASG